MKTLLTLIALTALAAGLAQPHSRHIELGPWYVTTIMPDGQPSKMLGEWKNREACEAAIPQVEKANRSYGSYCSKDELLEAFHGHTN